MGVGFPSHRRFYGPRPITWVAAGAASGMSRSRRAPPVACRDRGGRRQWHVKIAAGAASGMSGSRRAPPVACRDRGGRRQWHVGIVAGAASGMSRSRRAPPVACLSGIGIAAGLRCVVRASCERPSPEGVASTCVPCGPHVCGGSQQDEATTSTRAVPPARRDRTPSPLLRDETVGIHAYPRPSACAGSFPAFGAGRRRP
jgi:hypothetical protein